MPSEIKRINADFRGLEFQHAMAQVKEEGNSEDLFIILIDSNETQHELAMTYQQANDLRDIISLGIMSMIDFDDYDNVEKLDK